MGGSKISRGRSREHRVGNRIVRNASGKGRKEEADRVRETGAAPTHTHPCRCQVTGHRATQKLPQAPWQFWPRAASCGYNATRHFYFPDKSEILGNTGRSKTITNDYKPYKTSIIGSHKKQHSSLPKKILS